VIFQLGRTLSATHIFFTPSSTCPSTVSGQERRKISEKVNDQTTPLAEKESSNTHAARGELTENHKTIKSERKEENGSTIVGYRG
jgi:transcription elongation GreA/GreB family factor|tara:strand:- start:3100 stop:3354 length:255 start_codon:yes stop_codon:yes gene_type:complete